MKATVCVLMKWTEQEFNSQRLNFIRDIYFVLEELYGNISRATNSNRSGR